jgi:DNA-directed RNA polymerase specialized sigma24 family protein
MRRISSLISTSIGGRPCRLWANVHHRVRGTPDPEDLVGDTFVRVVRGLAGFEGNEEQFRAWVFAISRRRAIDLARTSARRPEKPDPATA